ncbi:ATP-grasp domain-containing protein [Mycobacterium branderi]|uniref:ATP-grasp domain-containing protein n=1 Tax=Mycobacterium branderi TaxID=43348 RepID=A0A7I7WDT4_9MYCO|nr:hypothetical protein [Mycobacterium branderi]MCV7235899.1 hypothetical protein [Mycobacterium branderi]ORA31153.1 hypothetical protein BST20_27475 [Mycobacterium branderi]BBZ14068.1 hypothetical protein MBRA_42630 [Mycobacterium branderi]
MKLARPDIRHPRIVLAGSGDDAGLIAALRTRGLHARTLPWDDPDTLRADLVILRDAPGDRGKEFLAWTRRVTNLLNAPDVVAWNSDRKYLRALERAGVPTQPKAESPAALVFFGGTQSYAFGPRGPVDADFELWDVGHAALRAAAEHVGIGTDELLYARADVTDDRRLTTLDLVAPSLGWELLDDATRQDAQRQFALCVESALERLGLGPLSHRRP